MCALFRAYSAIRCPTFLQYGYSACRFRIYHIPHFETVRNTFLVLVANRVYEVHAPFPNALCMTEPSQKAAIEVPTTCKPPFANQAADLASGLQVSPSVSRVSTNAVSGFGAHQVR